jgi:hypothetical protein
MYQDGVMVKESTGDITAAKSDNTNDVTVGWGELTGATLLSAKIDNLRFWRKGLTTIEIQNDRAINVTSETSNLLAAYDFESISGTTVPDIKGSKPGTIYDNGIHISNLPQFGMTGRGNTNDPILRAEVFSPSVTLSNTVLNLTGTTNLSDITSLKVILRAQRKLRPSRSYYKSAVLLVSCSPAAGDITCTLSGTLAAGTNYLWFTATLLTML